MQSQLENVVELEPAIAPQPLLAPSPPPATIPRRHDLDSLRAIAMLLGIGLHGALAYIPMPDAGWPIHDRRQSEFFALFGNFSK